MKIAIQVFLICVAMLIGAVIALYSPSLYQSRSTLEALEREAAELNKYSENLETSAQKISVGLRREDVEKIVRVAPDHIFFDSDRETVIWGWTAAQHVGDLHKSRRLSPTKGYFTLSVIFNREGQVERIFSGIN